MKTLLFIFTILMSTNNAHSSSWEDLLLEKNLTTNEGLSNFFDDIEHIKFWRDDSNYSHSISSNTPMQLSDKENVICGERIYATHPYALTKEYHHAKYAYYNHQYLTGDSYACAISNSRTNRCFRGKIPKYVVVSDTFMDECGNYFRGFWLVSYYQEDESMGTLLAKGRTAYLNPRSRFGNEYIPGNTYFMQRADFFSFTELFPGDRAKIERYRSQALQQGYRLENSLFIK